MSRLLFLFSILLGLMLVNVTGLPFVERGSTLSKILGATPVFAQQASKKKRRSIISILFGRKKARRKAVVKKSKRVRPRRKKRTIRQSSKRYKKVRPGKRIKKRNAKRITKKRIRSSVARGIVPALVVVEKTATAKSILVVGDFFSGTLAVGLDRAFKGVADVKVVDKSNGSSGFVRNDIVDWPMALPPLLLETKPAYIVAMLGSNDRQLMREDGSKLKKRTPEWDAAYKKRVEALGRVLKSSGIPYVWVGLPPVRFKSMNKDFLYFNELYEKAAQSRNGRFVDIWDGFSDAEGNYSRSGPDVDGQIVLLRPKDGINLTRAGRRRLAYYVQGQIEKTISEGDSAVNSSLAFDIEDNLPKTVTYNPARTGKTVIIRLDDPKVDGVLTLAGEKVKTSQASEDAFSVPVINKSTPLAHRRGRVDNYKWPPTAPPQGGTPALVIAN